MFSRLRHIRVRSHLLPLVLAALVLRALLPVGFMPGSPDGVSFMASTCAGQLEQTELPGKDAAPHCEFCTAPLLEAPLAVNHPRLPAPTLDAAIARLAPHSAQTPLARAQSARAPPAFS